MPARSFWHPPLWKWIVLLVLFAAMVVLIRWKPVSHPTKIELLPISDFFPASDASYPSVVISMTPESKGVRFASSIALIKPTVRHDAPVNQAPTHQGQP